MERNVWQSNIALLILQEIANLQNTRNWQFTNFWQNEQRNVDILQEILPSHPFVMSRKFETQGYQWYEDKRIKYVLANSKENNGTRFGAPLYYLK